MISRNSQRNKTDDEERSSDLMLLFDFQGPTVKVKLDRSLFFGKRLETIPLWGCSSVGRAPALQAGGQGFESLHLHHQG